MNNDVRKKISELFEICLELNKSDFTVFFSLRGHIDAINIEVHAGGRRRLEEDDYRDISDTYQEMGFYIDKPDNDVLSDIHLAKFELVEFHNKYRSSK